VESSRSAGEEKSKVKEVAGLLLFFLNGGLSPGLDWLPDCFARNPIIQPKVEGQPGCGIRGGVFSQQLYDFLSMA
jgi:hypothetical protein